MKCELCGHAELVEETRDLPYTYKGRKTVLKNIHGGWCPACGEVFFKLGQGDSDKYMEAVRAFKKEVNATQVNSAYVAAVRKRLKLGQREAGELFGGGVNAFSRYETGKNVPPVSLVQLFKILEQHPELMEILRNEEHKESTRGRVTRQISQTRRRTDIKTSPPFMVAAMAKNGEKWRKTAKKSRQSG